MQSAADLLALDIEKEFPTLHVEKRGSRTYVCGNYVVEVSGTEVGRYEIEIELPTSLGAVPKVFETGGKIAKHQDRHFNTVDRSACLFVPDEKWKHYPEGSTLVSLIRGPVRGL
jgi:hypothetical protein